MGDRRWGPVLLCALTIAAVACTNSSDDSEGATTTTGAAATTAASTATTGASDASTTSVAGDAGTTVPASAAPETSAPAGEGSGLLADNGPCDAALPTYPLGIMTVFESSLLSLIDQVHAAEASVEAFNARGGIGGHCMEITTCDTGLDPNEEVECARQFVDGGIVATINDTTAANPDGVIGVTQPAGLPRIGVSPGSQELNAPNSFPISGGSIGATVAMFPSLTRSGHTKIAVIHVDTPAVQALPAVLQPLLDAYGAEITTMIPVPSGTTDFQQFVLAAQDSGATGVGLALGEAEALQVLRAAEQLDSDLTFAGSLGSFGQSAAESLGEYADHVVFNSEVPPATGSQERWPILADVVADLSASGDDALQLDEIKSSAIRSWLAVDALAQVVEAFGNPDDISREAITAAFEAAQDVDFYGLVPPWTPRGGSGEGLFGAVSNPYVYMVTFDPGAGQFVIGDEVVNLAEEINGNLDYPQPAG